MFRFNSLAALGLVLGCCASGIRAQANKPIYQGQHIEVFRMRMPLKNNGGALSYHHLLYHRIHFGLNFLKPENRKDWGNSEKDYSRLAATYHARKGPVGIAMEKFNWFPGPANTYWADSRLPASLAGLGAGQGGLPMDLFAGLWSEPPCGVIGLEVGEMASYARPFQHVDFFERNPDIVELSLPAKGHPYFHYAADARARGALLRIFQGEPRPTLTKKGPHAFYHVLVVEPYKVGIEGIHKELLTKEGMALCMSKLAPGGVLCIHISNRYYHLSPVVADAARSLNLAYRHAYDQAPWNDRWHFSSEWVMVAKREQDLIHLKIPAGYRQAMKNNPARWPKETEAFWDNPKAIGKHLWTDKGTNSYRGLYRSDPEVGKLRYLLFDLQDALRQKGVSFQQLRPWMELSNSLINILDQWVVRNNNQPKE
jgi:hypothetical protein